MEGGNQPCSCLKIVSSIIKLTQLNKKGDPEGLLPYLSVPVF